MVNFARERNMGTFGSGGFAAALPAMFLYFVATLVVSTAICAMLAKLFAMQVPFRRHIMTCFKAFLPVLLLALAGQMVIRLAGLPMIPSGLNVPLAIAGNCAVGWLITRDLKSQGVPAKFPGVGAKVVTCYQVLILAVVVTVIMAVRA